MKLFDDNKLYAKLLYKESKSRLQVKMDRTANFYAQPTYAHGAGLPIYSGARRQRGGNVLGAIKSFFMPILSKLARQGVKSAASVAKNVAFDAFLGKNLKQSVKNRSINEAKNLGREAVNATYRGITGRRKRVATNKAKQRTKRRRANF